MVNSLNIKNVLLIVLVSASIVACKEKKETPEPEPVEETPTVTCFNSLNNGTYRGSGVTLSSPFTSGTLTVTRTSCQVVNLNLITDSAGQVITQASQLVLNTSNGTYDGKQTNGNDISLKFGSVLNLNAINSFTFTGTKQP